LVIKRLTSIGHAWLQMYQATRDLGCAWMPARGTRGDVLQ
jgi:transglutaminase-like putative cysteine protease